MKPQVVAAELGKRLRDDAIVSCDSGTIATWVGETYSCTSRTDAYVIRKSRDYGAGFALYDRCTNRFSKSSVRGFCGRRRIFDADG